MDLKEILKYKNWGDEKYIEICKKLSDKELHRKFEGFQNTIFSILSHIYETQHYWLNFIGIKVPEVDWESIGLEEVVKGIHCTNEIMLSNVNPDTTLTIQWFEEDKAVKTSNAEILFNFATHNAYHRGQLAVFLRMIGKEVSETDFNPYIYEKGQE